MGKHFLKLPKMGESVAEATLTKWLKEVGELIEVDDIVVARETLESRGARVLGNGKVKIGAHGNPVLFLHPKDFNGTLIELEQVVKSTTGVNAE